MKSETAFKNLIYRINTLFKVVLISGFMAFPLATFAQDTIPMPYQEILAPIVKAGTTGERYFGDLAIQFAIDSTGTVVVCTLYLATVLVGVHSLTATDPIYQFDLKSGESTANGTLSIYLNFSPSISTLRADMTYTVKANNTSFPYKGDLVGWYVYE
ncbi:hypothetical protein [Flavobacterium poyangense]|uniref:hypothetical protein n=1 Tax=Flavobacterium poyangense TaxID=2204302 RepID=UPI001423E3B1|nr:hypothetical protein [Flavobacterium sp. JXAS1]